MAITDYRIRFGTTWYEHREGGEASPLAFRKQLERAEGTTVTWGNGAVTVVNPESPDDSYHYLVDHLHNGAGPDEKTRFDDDTPLSKILF